MVTPAKAKQARRRYRALFQIGFSEYAAWLESEREVEKVLSSLDNVAWRTALVNGPVQTLGVLPQIPGAVDMMKKVHLRELERLMKQLKALISQLREQADRVAGAAHELSDLHYAEGAAVLQLDLQEGTRIGGPDPTQYFHWISSLRAALGLEMYRKGCLVEGVGFGSDAEAARARKEALEHWRAGSKDSALDAEYFRNIMRLHCNETP